MENYFASQRDNIFRNVEVLIYVFDVESHELEKDMHYYQSCLEAILQNSPEAKVFCLVHKMDLVQEDQRELVTNLHRLTDFVLEKIHLLAWKPNLEKKIIFIQTNSFIIFTCPNPVLLVLSLGQVG